jgi:serine/threonine protein kinase
MPALRLIDFGEGNTTELAAGFIAGTPGYQAPEVLDEGMCSMWSEMYSIGVSLIELWAGRVRKPPGMVPFLCCESHIDMQQHDTIKRCDTS